MAEAFEKTTDFDSIPLNLDEPNSLGGSANKSGVEIKAVSADSKSPDDILQKEKNDGKKTNSLKRFFSLKKAGEDLSSLTEDQSQLDNEHKRGSLARRLRLKSANSYKKDEKKELKTGNESNGQEKISKTKSLQNTLSGYWDNIFHSKNKENPSATINTETQTQTDSKEPSI